MRRVAFALLALVAGCRGTDLVPVTGRVTLDGRPLPNATVLFQPEDGNRNPGTGSTGRTDADGMFTLRQILPDRPGATPGRHRVRISLATTDNVREGNPGVESLPAIYNFKSEITRDVDAVSGTHFVFELSSTAK